MFLYKTCIFVRIEDVCAMDFLFLQYFFSLYMVFWLCPLVVYLLCDPLQVHVFSQVHVFAACSRVESTFYSDWDDWHMSSE